MAYKEPKPKKKSVYVPPANQPKPRPPKPGQQNDRISGRKGPK